MPQDGADTVIPRSVRLILIDCFETMVEYSPRGYHARKGIDEFLAHFVRELRVPLAVISDASREFIVAALKQAALEHQVAAVYHGGNSIEALPDGRVRKSLALPLADFGVRGDQAVFIGDSPLDAIAARNQGVPFIRVPRSEDGAFSFAALIHGPSRYQSSDFTAILLDRYGVAGS